MAKIRTEIDIRQCSFEEPETSNKVWLGKNENLSAERTVGNFLRIFLMQLDFLIFQQSSSTHLGLLVSPSLFNRRASQSYPPGSLRCLTACTTFILFLQEMQDAETMAQLGILR